MTITNPDPLPACAATFLNFAYGSNMASRRLRARTPSALPRGIARLAGHRLAWHKVGRDGSGKCDIVETGRIDDVVWGVLFEIAQHERPLLDAAEGLGCGYEHKSVKVLTADGLRCAGAYYATEIDATLLPFDWYLAFVLHGAHEHALPLHYLERLGAISAEVDADAVRRTANRALLGLG